MQHTLAHVTHEAVEKIGGIGTVLEGLITSPLYKDAVKRTILVGPCSANVEADAAMRLGESGKVLYSGVDGIDELGLGKKLHPIEWAFNVNLVYGTRTYDIPGDNRSGEAEVLLIDVFQHNADRLAQFKMRLAEMFGIDSRRYEAAWDYEEYVRLAEPAFYALNALLKEEDWPCTIFAHEFMGMPTALKAVLDGGDKFRTIFHAHECATARWIVEHHDGHDTMFYNAMKAARDAGLYAEDVFGDQSVHLRHALVSKAHVCDGVIAVGDDTAREMHFLGSHFDHHRIDLVYNGVPAMKVTEKQRVDSRELLADYAQAITGDRPDVLMTHVMRPVVSKGVWRDAATCHELDERLGKVGQTAVLFILTTGGGVRRPQDILHMEAEYGWPRRHCVGYPDLVGPEVEYNEMVEGFNATHTQVQMVLVNQFGWSGELIGKRLPEGMDIADFRRAADVEFGMATYEPFGISPLEPLCAGAICVISNVCGCAGFVDYVTEGEGSDLVFVADYTTLPKERTLKELLAMTREERDVVEAAEAKRIADHLMKCLPSDAKGRTKLLDEGQRLAGLMGWDRVIEYKLLPMLERVGNGKG